MISKILNVIVNTEKSDADYSLSPDIIDMKNQFCEWFQRLWTSFWISNPFHSHWLHLSFSKSISHYEFSAKKQLLFNYKVLSSSTYKFTYHYFIISDLSLAQIFAWPFSASAYFKRCIFYYTEPTKLQQLSFQCSKSTNNAYHN